MLNSQDVKEVFSGYEVKKSGKTVDQYAKTLYKYLRREVKRTQSTIILIEDIHHRGLQEHEIQKTLRVLVGLKLVVIDRNSVSLV